MESGVWERRQKWKQDPNEGHCSLFFLVGAQHSVCGLAKLPTRVSSMEQTGALWDVWGVGNGLEFSLFFPQMCC